MKHTRFIQLALALGFSLTSIAIALGLPIGGSVEASGNPFGKDNGQPGWIAQVEKTNFPDGNLAISIPDFNTDSGFQNGIMPIGDGLALVEQPQTSGSISNEGRTKITPVSVVDANGGKVGEGVCWVTFDNGNLGGTANDAKGECHASGKVEKH